ncbi:MAG: hypothetical protein J6S85_05055 [Methanobrevibacter sp.]|nr:hypothetical protein [Methanobrevibacter sp.]
MNVHQGLFEAYRDFSQNLSMELSCEIHGKINAHYNPITDAMQVTIINRALNIEPFRFTQPYFSRDMANGISSSTLSRFILKEYREYIELYIFKKY